MTGDKVDLFKANKEQYRAGKHPILVDIPSAVYLSDPRRVPPEKLRTIVRIPVAPV